MQGLTLEREQSEGKLQELQQQYNQWEMLGRVLLEEKLRRMATENERTCIELGVREFCESEEEEKEYRYKTQIQERVKILG